MKRTRRATKSTRRQPTRSKPPPRAKPRGRRRAVKAKPRVKAAVKKRIAKPRAAASVEALQKQIRRLRAARARLERRLTSAVQEIGMLRQIEFRVQRLEEELSKRDAELAKRDADIARMRMERADQLRQLELRLGGASILATPS